MAEIANPNCLLCGERAANDNFVHVMYELGANATHPTPRWVHDDCGLREVLGGIGHLIAHEYWCLQQHDPDAGLTYRQSALLVYQWTKIVGTATATELVSQYDRDGTDHPVGPDAG